GCWPAALAAAAGLATSSAAGRLAGDAALHGSLYLSLQLASGEQPLRLLVDGEDLLQLAERLFRYQRQLLIQGVAVTDELRQLGRVVWCLRQPRPQRLFEVLALLDEGEPPLVRPAN